MNVSDSVFKVIADIWLAPSLEYFLNLCDDFSVVFWLKVHVLHKPVLGLFKKLALLDTCCADFKLSTVIAACTWVRL